MFGTHYNALLVLADTSSSNEFPSEPFIHYNTLLVLAGTGLLGMVAGIVGAFAVLRRRALMGDALSHAALPGLCLAFMLLGALRKAGYDIGERNFFVLLAGAATSGIVGVVCVSLMRQYTRIKEDAAIGLVLSVFFGAGIVLSSVLQDRADARQAGLDSYLLGQTAGMVMQDLYFIIGATLAALLVLAAFYKEFKILSFDREFAAVQGWPTLALDLLMMGLLVLTTVIGLPAVGVVLMAALLITPGVSARFWTDRLGVLLALAGAFGLVTGVCGSLASARFKDLPAGPVIVLTGSAIFVFSMLFAPRRGILARTIEHLRLRSRIARQNLLRGLYEIAEPRLPAREPVAVTALAKMRAWTPHQVRALLAAARRRGQVEFLADDSWRLTEAGLTAAAEVVRVHRLWETFLIENADIAPDHVDRDADQIEHILAPDLIARLEAALRQAGRWPAGAGVPVPASPHVIQPPEG